MCLHINSNCMGIYFVTMGCICLLGTPRETRLCGGYNGTFLMRTQQVVIKILCLRVEQTLHIEDRRGKSGETSLSVTHTHTQTHTHTDTHTHTHTHAHTHTHTHTQHTHTHTHAHTHTHTHIHNTHTHTHTHTYTLVLPLPTLAMWPPI